MYFVIISRARYFYHTVLSLAASFITVLYNICYDSFLISQMFTIFLFMELSIGCLETFPLDIGGQMGKSTYAIWEGS